MPPISIFMFDFKTTIIAVLAVALFLVSWIKGCQVTNLRSKLAKCQQAEKPKPTIDTQYILVPQQAALASTLTQTNSIKPSKPRIDSFITYEVVVDTTDLTRLKTAYYELASLYNERNKFVDTSIFKNGISITNTTVYQNKIEEQKTVLDSIRQEIIYNTVYKEQKSKDRTQLYLGIEAFGDQKEFINAAGFYGFFKIEKQCWI
jgi:hypothetical protein